MSYATCQIPKIKNKTANHIMLTHKKRYDCKCMVLSETQNLCILLSCECLHHSLFTHHWHHSTHNTSHILQNGGMGCGHIAMELECMYFHVPAHICIFGNKRHIVSFGLLLVQKHLLINISWAFLETNLLIMILTFVVSLHSAHYSLLRLCELFSPLTFNIFRAYYCGCVFLLLSRPS